MLKLFAVLFSLLLSLSANAQQLPQSLIPPNTVLVAGDLYVDKTEVANIHWLEFLYYIRQDSGEQLYTQMLPDTLAWAQRNLGQAQVSSITLTKEYLRGEKYQQHPVVGISYEQASAYAQWRSAVVNSMMNQPEALQKLGLAGKRVIIEYRLPTEEEWMQAAAGVLAIEKYPFGYKKYQEKAHNSIDPQQAWEGLSNPSMEYIGDEKKST